MIILPMPMPPSSGGDGEPPPYPFIHIIGLLGGAVAGTITMILMMLFFLVSRSIATLLRSEPRYYVDVIDRFDRESAIITLISVSVGVIVWIILAVLIEIEHRRKVRT